MAKKGGVQQLQADISTDEEFEKFLERSGLLVLDVYSEWCGPCLGMVGSLKKIKLELGGDNLQLAICKSDTISYLKRFNKKSEPTWLFVTRGRAVNLMFGTDVPKLMKLIATELTKLGSKEVRTTYAITELQPEEVKRRKVKEDAIAEAARIEFLAEEKKRRDYLTFVTDSIMENLPDMGVTVFGPQVNRDMFKKIVEPADVLKLQCKDRKVVPVFKENFDVVNFACKNPLDEDVLEQLYEKELLMCFWKMPEDSSNKVDKIMTAYAHALTTQRIEVDEFGIEEDHVIPPILTPLELVVEVELAEGEEYVEEEEAPPPESEFDRKSRADGVPSADQADDELGDEAGEGEDEGEGEGGEGEAGEEMAPPPPLELDMGDMGFELEGDELAVEEEAEPELVIEEPAKPRMRKKKIIIPPVWVPNNTRTHAALIYVFFRNQTTPFLEPDPTPEPPCIIMAFDAYKKKDLINVAKRHPEDVPLFGFFTSDDPEEASYIANSESKYASQPHTASDKIVFKVSKKTSHTMLSLATYGPSYVSPNTVVGHEEALRFFPENYKTAEQELLEAKEHEAQQPEKKRKSKAAKVEARKSDAFRKSDASTGPSAATPASVSATGEEGATTTSGEESGDSMPPTVEEGAEDAAPPADEAAAPAAEDAAPPPPSEATAETAPPPAAEAPPPPEEAPPAAEEPAAQAPPPAAAEEEAPPPAAE